MKSAYEGKSVAEFLMRTAASRQKLKRVAYQLSHKTQIRRKLQIIPSPALASETQLLPLTKRPTYHSPVRLHRDNSPFLVTGCATERHLFHIPELVPKPVVSIRKTMEISRIYQPTTPSPPHVRRLQRGTVTPGRVSPGQSSFRSRSPTPVLRRTCSPLPVSQSRKRPR